MKILLKELRTARNLSQNKLARLLDMSPQNVQRIEYGDAKAIPLKTLDKLCNVLRCQPGDILVWVDDDNHESKDSSPNNQTILEQEAKNKNTSNSNLLPAQDSSPPLSIVPDRTNLPNSA